MDNQGRLEDENMLSSTPSNIRQWDDDDDVSPTVRAKIISRTKLPNTHIKSSKLNIEKCLQDKNVFITASTTIKST